MAHSVPPRRTPLLPPSARPRRARPAPGRTRAPGHPPPLIWVSVIFGGCFTLLYLACCAISGMASAPDREPEVELAFERTNYAQSVGTARILTSRPLGELLLRADPIQRTIYRNGFPSGVSGEPVPTMIGPVFGVRSPATPLITPPPPGTIQFVVNLPYWQAEGHLHLFERLRDGRLRPVCFRTTVPRPN